MFSIPRRCESLGRKNELATIPENGAVCSYLGNHSDRGELPWNRPAGGILRVVEGWGVTFEHRRKREEKGGL